jgi:hypothetical protein
VVYDEERSNRKPTTMPPSDKTKDTPPKKTPVVESKVVETAAKTETSKTETPTPETSKSETSPKAEAKPDAVAKKQGMGEGQKPVTQAYKDNWNAIFAKKKKR